MVATSAFLAPLLFLVQDPAGADKAAAPAGLIRIPAGKVAIGRDPKEMEKLIQASPISKDELGAMTPKWEASLPEFYIGPTEVTNEMYLRFVQATGHQPPVSWFVLSRELRLAILEDLRKNDPTIVLDDMKLARWWDEHWKDETWTGPDDKDPKQTKEYQIKWEMPAHKALEPVVSVSQQDAKAYCRWAGLRLPSEEEWVRAARGDDYRTWPFGDKFDKKLVASMATDPPALANKLLPAGLFKNASPFGCFDMSGNAWEWTGSTYNAYKDFKSWKVKTNAGEVTVLPAFDASLPVIKGGSFSQPEWGTQIDVRVGVFAPARLPVVGFRVASSTLPGRNWMLLSAEDVDYKVLGATAAEALDFDQTLGLEKRRYADLAALEKARKPYPSEDRIPSAATPAGYAVFDGYQALAVTPLKALDYAAVDKLNKAAEEHGPVPVAVFVTGVALAEPALVPGSYVLAYLPKLDDEDILAMGATLPAKLMEEYEKKKGKKPAADKADAKEEEKPKNPEALLQDAKQKADLTGLELHPDRPHLVFINLENKALAAVEMKFEPKLESAKQIDHKLVLDLGHDSVQFFLRANGPRGKAFGFPFRVKPIGDGGSLVKEGYWEGSNYEVKKAEPTAGSK